MYLIFSCLHVLISKFELETMIEPTIAFHPQLVLLLLLSLGMRSVTKKSPLGLKRSIPTF